MSESQDATLCWCGHEADTHAAGSHEGACLLCECIGWSPIPQCQHGEFESHPSGDDPSVDWCDGPAGLTP